jgi:hypothetical protein
MTEFDVEKYSKLLILIILGSLFFFGEQSAENGENLSVVNPE